MVLKDKAKILATTATITITTTGSGGSTTQNELVYYALFCFNSFQIQKKFFLLPRSRPFFIVFYLFMYILFYSVVLCRVYREWYIYVEQQKCTCVERVSFES